MPSATRQGQYTCMADGTLLASCNVRKPEDLLAMLQTALERWEQRPPASATASTPASYEPDPAHPSLYPEDGLVLRVASRDLPRDTDSRPDDWRKDMFNLDFAWFTRDEARSLVPDDPQPGQTIQVPEPLVRRLARFHILDNARGETPAWRPDHVREANMTASIVHSNEDEVELRLEGTVRNEAHGIWAIRPFQEQAERERGMHAHLLGKAIYNRSRDAFDQFTLLAVADRWGGTEHNCRWDDLEPAPLGIAFTIAGRAPSDRVPPHANLWDYFDLQRPPR